MSVMTYVTGVP